MDQVIKTIEDKYNQRMNKLTKYKQLSAHKNSIPIIFELININMYLMLVAKNEKLAKWMLINQCFKDSTALNQDLETIGKSDIIYLKLSQHYSADTLNLRPEEKIALTKYKVEFMFFQLRANLLNFILERINSIYEDCSLRKPVKETDWIDIMTAIHIQNKE